MTPAHQKAKIALIEQGRTFRDLSNACGIQQTVISNTLSGRTASRRTQQILTNAIGIQLWDGIPVTQRSVTFPIGTLVEYKTAEEARESVAKELAAGIVTRRGRVVTFVQTATFTVNLDTQNQSGKNRKIAASSYE